MAASGYGIALARALTTDDLADKLGLVPCHFSTGQKVARPSTWFIKTLRAYRLPQHPFVTGWLHKVKTVNIERVNDEFYFIFGVLQVIIVLIYFVFLRLFPTSKMVSRGLITAEPPRPITCV